MNKILIAVALCAALVGCKSAYKGGKIVEGTDAFVGVNMPFSDGVVQFEALNYLSGARFSFDRNAGITFSYSITNDTSFCGMYTSHTVKHMSATLDPTMSEADTNETVTVEAEMR